MSFDEILVELPKLTPEQRDLLRVRLSELEEEGWVADHESNLAATQLAALGGKDPKAVAGPRRKAVRT